jgi:hypothetical protein
MNPATLISLTECKSLPLDHIPGGGAPAWTHAEAAFACGGLTEYQYLALRYEYARDDSRRSTLALALFEWALERRELQELIQKHRRAGSDAQEIADAINARRRRPIVTPDAVQMIARDGEPWPRKVIRSGMLSQYMRDLVDLYLCEVRAPYRFVRRANAPDMRRVILDVSEPVWRRRVAPVYVGIRDHFIDWRDSGARSIARRIA